MKNTALLLRVNQEEWLDCEIKLVRDKEVEVWFKTGRRKPEAIIVGTPVIVLATKGQGIIATGRTVKEVIRCSDPDFREMKDQEDYKQEVNRVCVKIKRIAVPLSKLKEVSIIANLDRTRETTTWLNSDQHQALEDLISKQI